MLLGGGLILITSLEPMRADIYQYVHVWFFIAGALFFYILLYRTGVVPRFIALWGGFAVLALTLVVVLTLLGVAWPGLGLLVIPIVLNEVFLAFWLIFRGFSPPV